MSTASTVEVFEYAAELGDRFPDLTNDSVLLSVADYCDKVYTEDDPLGQCIITAYVYCSATRAAMELSRTYGISVG